jgi:hypothetical protein
MMNVEQENALLKATLKEILSIDDAAGRGDQPGCMPMRYALSGSLRYRWMDIRLKAKQLLDGKVG